MILLGSNLNSAPIMSLQTGAQVAKTVSPIIDPADLSIRAYRVAGSSINIENPVLLINDTRELSDLGFIIDSTDEIVSVQDVIKLEEITKLNFNLLDMPVNNERRTRLGRVIDFTIDTNTFTVQQLTVRRPLLKSFSDTELVIHRSQIIEINNQAIVVHSEAKSPEPQLNEVVGSYVNPFRKSNPATQDPTPTVLD